jgi:hypothetical protein
MKTIRLVTIGIAALAFAFTGCKKSEGVDTKPLETSFASAEPATKTSSDKAVAAIKAGNYSEGMAELGKLAQQAKLTPEQQQAVKDTIEQVKKQLAEAMNKATEGASKAAGDLQKALPGSK